MLCEFAREMMLSALKKMFFAQKLQKLVVKIP